MRIIYFEQALKSLKKMDKQVQRLIISYMDKIALLEEPRSRGKALSANLRGFWRYRVGDYRILCQIQDEKIVICVVDINHRKNIYNR